MKLNYVDDKRKLRFHLKLQQQEDELRLLKHESVSKSSKTKQTKEKMEPTKSKDTWSLNWQKNSRAPRLQDDLENVQSRSKLERLAGLANSVAEQADPIGPRSTNAVVEPAMNAT